MAEPRMATLTFLWHLHQPAYRTADGVAHAPWVALHAGGAYATLLGAIERTRCPGQVVNVVPTLLEQLEAYAAGTVRDPALAAIATPVAALDESGRREVAAWAPHVPPRRLEALPRLEELLASLRSAEVRGREPADALGPAEIRDLQVLTVLAHAGAAAARAPELEPLLRRGRRFAPADHAAAAAWLRRQPRVLLERLRRVAAIPGVEIATSPHAHPIVPLLLDTAIVTESWAPAPAPEVPAFSRPGDARRQIAEGLAFARARGLDVVGCWPPEGAVSAAAVHLYAEAGVAWLVTDQEILARSLGRDPVASGEVYRPWRLGGEGPVLLFRHREASDRIGFVYGHWDDERAAARDLVDRLAALARGLPAEASVVIALDGENPWAHYPAGGAVFLEELLAAVARGETGLVPATCRDLATRPDAGTLERLHPGSWIGGTFATWIGHPEKARAWALLAEVRELLPDDPARLPASMLLAEGSDWFWWLGDDNPSPHAPLYDAIFRHHLADACEAAGVAPPESLGRPLKPALPRLEVPVSRRWRPPVLDGRITSYFEWSLAAWREQRGIALAAWGDGELLHVLVRPGAQVERVELEDPSGSVVRVEPGDEPVPGGPRWAVGAVLEVSLPWRPAAGVRLWVTVGGRRLGTELRPLEVDEEL